MDFFVWLTDVFKLTYDFLQNSKIDDYTIFGVIFSIFICSNVVGRLLKDNAR